MTGLERGSGEVVEVAARPELDAAGAAELVDRLFGVRGEVVELGSHQDRNFRVRTAEGPLVLKVANRAWGRAALEAQNAALLHLVERGVRGPEPRPAVDGSLLVEAEVGGEALPVRVLTYVEGTPLSSSAYLAAPVVAALGGLAGRVAAALATFEHPGLDRVGQWDLRRASSLVDELIGSVPDAGRRATVVEAATAAADRLRHLEPLLRVQAIHGDITDDNVVGRRDDAGRVVPDAVIDFGDLGRSWLVAELAVSCSSVLRHRPDAWTSVLDAVRAFHAEVPLDDADVAALWPLVVLRGAQLVVAGQHQAALDPDNPSATEPLESEWGILEAAWAVQFDLAEEAVRAALGLDLGARARAARTALASSGPLVPEIVPAVVDLSSTSDALPSGSFLDDGAEAAVLDAAASAAGSAATSWGQARLTRTRPLSAAEPATVALGVDLVVPAGQPLAAPFDGVLRLDGGEVVLDDSVVALRLTGITCGRESGDAISRGEALGVVEGTRLHVQAAVPGLAPPPRLTARTEAAGWLRLCPDPSALLGISAQPSEGADAGAALLDRRLAAFARVQEHYYAAPMRVERGWQHLLIDTDGRSYVDMVNNVAAIGHGHPRLADAVDRQLRLLNTNSRFHYGAVAELSERLVALAPDGLDTVFLVNSGSEAVDLALRIAQVVTGRQDVVAVREAYHGWTYLSDAVTTSLYDNPRALETRPDWIHLASAPNPYRGRFRGPGSGAEYALELRELLERIASEGRPPAAYICEPMLGNAGGIELPEGYLAAAYDAVRAVGGLCIADEVQVGYGRTGHQWWAFEKHGVTPDLITVAKAMGNGHPLGAVICRREVAEAFSAHGSFFSSAGGSPVSCVVGLTVLDVIEDEGLQRNAAEVGDHLVARCEALLERFPIVGAIHGEGLYLGVELVRDRVTLEPATAECYAICDRLRELGVIVQPTGERANVLKMKPPMCLTLEAADFYVDQLERVLAEGW